MSWKPIDTSDLKPIVGGAGVNCICRCQSCSACSCPPNYSAAALAGAVASGIVSLKNYGQDFKPTISY